MTTIYLGLDGRKVTMYAQWRSAEDYQAMRENPEPLQSVRHRRASNRPGDPFF